MSTKFIVAHRIDRNNVGDMASNPLQYFLSPDEYTTIDITQVGKASWDHNVPLILGGGGLFGNSLFGDIAAKLSVGADRQQLQDIGINIPWTLQNSLNEPLYNTFRQRYQELISSTLMQMVENTGVPKYVWGAGYNSDDMSGDVNYSPFMSEFNAVGLRDWAQGSRYEWIPCASCMHPALRRTYSIRNDIIWFEHKKQFIKDFGKDSIPRFVNAGSNIEQTIELLGSANIILTNSYHGAFWGVLLKKRVVVVDPWSSKFMHFKHTPAIANKKISWKTAIDMATTYHSAIDECIQTTENFWQRIKG